MTFAGVWVLAAVVVWLVVGASTPGVLALLAGFGLLPPLALWFLWNEPQETMSQSIRGGRR
jgi:RsiW-degrading membrane proteinase PrsW (M82 family)